MPQRPTSPSSAIASNKLPRGVQRLWHPQVLGALIGASGATAFVLANRDALPSPWPAIAAVLWAAALAAFLGTVLLRRRRLRNTRPEPHAGLVYAGSVLGMLVAFIAGRAVLAALARLELMPGLIVLAVGLHFLPFASKFRAPVFATLGWALAAIGVLGLGLGVVGGAVPVAGAAVMTGVVMLIVMAVDAVRPGPSAAPADAATR